MSSKIDEMIEIIEDQGREAAEFREVQIGRIDAIEQDLVRLGRPNFSSGNSRSEGTEDRALLAKGCRALLAGDQEKAQKFFLESKGMSVGVDPDGGYLNLPTFSSVMTKVSAEISPVSKLARTIQLTHGLTFEEIIDRDTAAASWVNETQTRVDTAAPALGKFVVTCGELTAMPKATQTLIDASSIDVVEWLSTKIAESFAATESVAFHTGSGLGRPRGFLDYPTLATADATRAWGTTQHIATGASGAFPTGTTSVNPADPLISVVAALKAQYRNGAVWMMNRATAAVIRQIKDVTGRYVWVDSLQLNQPSLLLGYPVEISEDMPAIAADALPVVFGNFQRAYTIVRRLGTRFLVDPYSDKPNVKLFAYQRVGGGLNNSEALKFLKMAAS